ncbi:MAG: hypothetical protein SOT09_02845 [Candidatus Borkfalkiaceae bacterium]|nr:hypothetical protein [Christensenellaceae bacterium]
MKKHIISTTLAFLLVAGISLLLAFAGKIYFSQGENLDKFRIMLAVFSVVILFAALGVKPAVAIRQMKTEKTDVAKNNEELKKKSDFARRNKEKFFKKTLLKRGMIVLYLFFLQFIIVTTFFIASLLMFVRPFAIAVVILTADAVFSCVKHFLVEDEVYYPEIEIDENEYSELYSLLKVVYAAFGIKRVISFVTCDAGIAFRRRNGINELHIGISAYQLMSDEELKAAIYREIAFESDKNLKKLSRYDLYIEKFKRMAAKTFLSGKSFGFLRLLEGAFVFDRVLFEREISSATDKKIAETPYSLPYARAFKKMTVYDCFVNDERCNINKQLFSSELSAGSYGDFILDEFFIHYGLYGAEWEREIERRFSPEIPVERTFAEKLSDLNVDFERTELTFDKSYDDEYHRIMATLNEINFQCIKEEYRARKEGYEYMLNQIARYENNREDFNERRALLNIAECYKVAGDFDNAIKIYNQLSENGKETSELLFEKGVTLLTVKDDSGIDLLLRATENENYTERALSIIDTYLINSGKRRKYTEFIKIKNEKLQKLYSAKKDFDYNFDNGFIATGAGEDFVKSVVEFSAKDENIVKIFISDNISKNGKPITVLGFNVKNSDNLPLYETYQRLFSLLDNEFGHIDTFLVPLDIERKLTKKFLKEKTSLKYDVTKDTVL